MNELRDILVLIKGAGDLGSGIAVRLAHCGFSLLMTEIEFPLAVRRTVSFSEAVYDQSMTVEDITAKRVSSTIEAREAIEAGFIPILVDPDGAAALSMKPHVVVDAIMAKRNTRTRITDAPVVVGLGPGFCAGEDVHAVIETNRGHNLGRVIMSGTAEPDTGVPGTIGGFASERVLLAPTDGIVTSNRSIGENVRAGETIAHVGGTPVAAEISGILRGLIRSGIAVHEGTKIGDIDPRAKREYCFTVSDKALAIGGGALEAMLRLLPRGS